MDQLRELRNELQALLTELVRASWDEATPAESRYLQASIDLVRMKLTQLDDVIGGSSTLPAYRAYLSISSLNKGLFEIGASAMNRPRLGELKEAITMRAYSMYKSSRPASPPP